MSNSIGRDLREVLGDDVADKYDALMDAISAADVIQFDEHPYEKEKNKKDFSDEYGQAVLNAYTDMHNVLKALESLNELAKVLALCPTQEVRAWAPFKEISAHLWTASNAIDKRIETIQELSVQDENK